MRGAMCLAFFVVSILQLNAQINTQQVMNIGRNALYFEDYLLSIQYFKTTRVPRKIALSQLSEIRLSSMPTKYAVSHDRLSTTLKGLSPTMRWDFDICPSTRCFS